MTKTRTPATEPSCSASLGVLGGMARYVAAEHSAHTAPVWSLHGTGVSAAGGSVALSTAPAAVLTTTAFLGACGATALVAIGARVTDLPGFPPRGAPV